MKKTVLSTAVLILLALALEWIQTTQSILAMLKYGCMAYGMVGVGVAIQQRFIKRTHPICHYLAVILLCLYTVLLFDTFTIHAWTWFPGILRYPIFSFYIPGDLLFVLVGCMLKVSERKLPVLFTYNDQHHKNDPISS